MHQPTPLLRPGVAVLFASTTMVVPPLNRTLLKKHAPTLRDIQALATGASEALDPSDLFDKQCAMVFDALLLNYPQLKQEDFDDLIDMYNMQSAFPAACGNLAQAREVNAKNAAAESLCGSSTGTQTPPASLHGLDGLSGPAGT